RQIFEQQKKNLQASQRAAVQGAEQAAGQISVGQLDPDEFDESLIRLAAERAAGFKINDWNSDELYALASLYQIAEQFSAAAEALRSYLKNNAKSKLGPIARGGLIHSLIETRQLAEAEKLLEGTEWDIDDDPGVRTHRTGLYKDLALILHSRYQYDEAAKIVDKGYEMARSLASSENLLSPLRGMAEQNQVILGALKVVMSERIEGKKAANEVNKLMEDLDFNHRPELRMVYESELRAARLIGTSAPELDVAR